MTDHTTAERAAFEEAMSAEPFCWHRHLWANHDGDYLSKEAAAAWFAWQAACAWQRATLPAPRGEAICSICDGGPGNNCVCSCGLKQYAPPANTSAASPATRAVPAETIHRAHEIAEWIWDTCANYCIPSPSAYIESLLATPSVDAQAAVAQWISVDDRLPNDETPVLIVYQGVIRVGELRWDYPGHEDNYEAFRYWDDPVDDGQAWEWADITHWMPLPAAPIAPALPTAHDKETS